MKFAVPEQTTGSWSAISASSVDSDAHPPISTVRFHWPLGTVQVDRLAAGCVLMFSPWASGRVDMPSAISALTAQRITEWSQTQRHWLTVSTIRTGGLPIPRGNRTLALSGARSGTEEQPTLTFLPPTTGTQDRGSEIGIATNLEALMRCAPDAVAAGTIRIGAAVLLAESLNAGQITDPEFAAEDPTTFSYIQRLLECVALGLDG